MMAHLSKPYSAAMSRKLPASITPGQVVDLYDALLSNADSLLRAADSLLNQGQEALAQSLAILGLEESGKAIAIFERRLRMATAEEGETFFTDEMRKFWTDHNAKLLTVHRFLVAEQYWFGVEQPIHDLALAPRETYLKTIQTWAREDNVAKQNGFYVGITDDGSIVSPQASGVDRDAVAAVLQRVHQIGWQLRLGEHIEAKALGRRAAGTPPMSLEDQQEFRSLFERTGVDPAKVDDMMRAAGEGESGVRVNNAQWTFALPDATNPFRNLGRPGYEAETREVLQLLRDVDDANDDPVE